MEFDAAPLEAAFFQDVAGRRVGDAGAGNQVFAIEFLKEEIDHRARSFGAEALAPMMVARTRDSTGSYAIGFTILIALGLVGAVAVALLPKRAKEVRA